MEEGARTISFGGVVTEIMRETSYKLPDFYIKSYLEGGLTTSQVDGLYENIQEAKRLEFEIQAKLHGCEIGDSSSSSSGKQAEHPNVPMFGDLNNYEHMSTEEREAETQRMMGKHKRWSGEAINIDSKPTILI